MAADGFNTQDVCFAAAMLYAYGEESLDQIVIDDNGRATFSMRIASLDAEEYLKEFHAGNFSISDLKSFWKRLSFLNNTIRKMRREDEILWQNHGRHGQRTLAS